MVEIVKVVHGTKGVVAGLHSRDNSTGSTHCILRNRFELRRSRHFFPSWQDVCLATEVVRSFRTGQSLYTVVREYRTQIADSVALVLAV